MATPAVALHHITRRFGSLVANDDVSLELYAGEILGLVGENGAGKTTLMRVLCGQLLPHRGHIEIDGRPVRIARPADAIRLSLGMVHQHFMLVDSLTVAENVTLGAEPSAKGVAFRRAEAEHRVAELSRRFGMPVDPKALVRTLSVGQQQRVEILKALHHGARTLVLDEPTAVLVPQEVDELFRVLRELKARGTTIVVITHKLAEVRAIADRVTVMRAGRVVGGGPIGELSNERISELMVGRTVRPIDAGRSASAGAIALEVHDLEVADGRGLAAVRRLSFRVRSAEILGVAGVEGNGQHELVECLAGLRPALGGSVLIDGRPAPEGVRARIRAGLAHLPADRRKRGLIAEMTLAENLALGLQRSPAIGAGPWLDPAALARRAEPLIAQYDVRPASPAARAGTLSGGNQQKLVAARELSRGAKVILAAHPTRGLDLGATEFIHRQLIVQRDAGCAVLLVSSELSEILALSDRVVVLYEGSIVLESPSTSTDERTLGLYMTGQRKAAS